MSNPVQTPNPAGEPGSAYTPGQPGYAVPDAPAKRTNGWAIAGLIFSIIGGVLFGLIFGIVGLVKSKSYRSGRVMSIIAIVLSLIWIAPIAYVTPHLIKAADPGCRIAESNVQQLDDKLTADQNNPQAYVADVQALIQQLNDAASKSHSAAARDAMSRTAADFQELLSGVQAGQAPSADLAARLTTDGNAVDKECGKF